MQKISIVNEEKYYSQLFSTGQDNLKFQLLKICVSLSSGDWPFLQDMTCLQELRMDAY